MAVKPWNPWVHRTLLTLCVVLGAVAVREVYSGEPDYPFADQGYRSRMALGNIQHMISMDQNELPLWDPQQYHPQVLFTSTSKRHTPKPCLEGQYWNSQYKEVRWECH